MEEKRIYFLALGQLLNQYKFAKAKVELNPADKIWEEKCEKIQKEIIELEKLIVKKNYL